jgi:hypothetical protein
MPQFKTTSDVFAVVRPTANGKYRCPVEGCPDKKKVFVDSKDFGRHLSFKHNIHSPKHDKKAGDKRRYKLGELPTLTVKHCPNCGFHIEEFEQAAALLLRTSR